MNADPNGQPDPAKVLNDLFNEYATKEAEFRGKKEAVRKDAKRRGVELEREPGGTHTSAGDHLFCSAQDLLKKYIDKIQSGTLPQLLRQHQALDGIEIGQGLITIIGAPPGAGKTALASQVMFDACELDENLQAYIVNAEMGFDSLVRRQLTKMTRIKSDNIRFGNLTTDELRSIQESAVELAKRLDRVSVYQDPDLSALVDLLDQPPGLVIVDYLQKFAPADKDVRAGVNVVVNVLRKLANHGHAILALSATKRAQNGKHEAKELGLSSFKESGEVEFNADSAYVLKDDGPIDEECKYIRIVTLAHVKNRHGAKVDRQLEFHMPRMEFTRHEEQPAIHEEFADYAESPFGGPQ